MSTTQPPAAAPTTDKPGTGNPIERFLTRLGAGVVIPFIIGVTFLLINGSTALDGLDGLGTREAHATMTLAQFSHALGQVISGGVGTLAGVFLIMWASTMYYIKQSKNNS